MRSPPFCLKREGVEREELEYCFEFVKQVFFGTCDQRHVLERSLLQVSVPELILFVELRFCRVGGLQVWKDHGVSPRQFAEPGGVRVAAAVLEIRQVRVGEHLAILVIGLEERSGSQRRSP